MSKVIPITKITMPSEVRIDIMNDISERTRKNHEKALDRFKSQMISISTENKKTPCVGQGVFLNNKNQKVSEKHKITGRYFK